MIVCFRLFMRTLISIFLRLIKNPNLLSIVLDIGAFNKQEGLALNDEEIEYLEKLSQRLGRKLTDSEVFGFSQVNSEHCRHKIFNGTFIIDGQEMPETLFGLIKKTAKGNPNQLVSAYKDNVAFVEGPVANNLHRKPRINLIFSTSMILIPLFHLKLKPIISPQLLNRLMEQLPEPAAKSATGWQEEKEAFLWQEQPFI